MIASYDYRFLVKGAAAGGTGPYEYRFEVRSVTNDGDRRLLQDFSGQATVNWDTTGYLGKNRIRVLARKAGSLDLPVRPGQAYWRSVGDPGVLRRDRRV